MRRLSVDNKEQLFGRMPRLTGAILSVMQQARLLAKHDDNFRLFIMLAVASIKVIFNSSITLITREM